MTLMKTRREVQHKVKVCNDEYPPNRKCHCSKNFNKTASPQGPDKDKSSCHSIGCSNVLLFKDTIIRTDKNGEARQATKNLLLSFPLSPLCVYKLK